MVIFAHVAAGALLLALAVWLFVRAAKVETLWSARLPDKVIQIAAFGAKRERWLWQLRVANVVLAVIALIGAVALWSTA
jgi:hypothetical protein